MISQLSGVRVLLVDDQEDIRLLVALILSTNGAKVQVCDSADKALVMVKTWKPDVIVSDIVMPEHDGYWFIRHVRLLHPKKGGRIPAVALTALTSTADRARTLTAGFQMHIGKPFIPEDVVSAVEKLTRE